jgi:exopolysaccharide production protein ExoQ
LRFAKTLAWFEAAFTIVTLELFMGALTPIFFQGGEEVLTEEAKESVRKLTLPFYAITLLLLLSRMRESRVLPGIKANWHLVALLFLTWLSIAWSIDPEVSLRRCTALLFMMLFGIYLCQRYELTAILRLIAVACAVNLVLSIALIALVPSIGVSSIDGRWRGIFGHKNSLGQNLLIAVIVFAAIDVKSRGGQALRWAGIGVATTLLWLSDSRGPFIALLPAIPLSLLIWSARFGVVARAALVLPIVTLTFLAAALVFLNADEMFDLLGKDSTLTGRTELWSFVWAAITDRPWLGYGFSTFWETSEGPSHAIWEFVRWDAPGSHNGYMEMWLGLGILGPTLVLISMGINLRNAILALRNKDVAAGRWCLFLLVVLGVASLNEDDLPPLSNIFTILYVVATFFVQRAAMRRRVAPRRLPRTTDAFDLTVPSRRPSSWSPAS